MATLAQGQITLVDYTDGSQITGVLSANAPEIQTINPDNGSRSPDWSSQENKLVITPFFRRSGTTGLTTILDSSTKSTSVTSVKWYIDTTIPDEVNRFPGGTPISNTSHGGSVFAVASGTALYTGGPKYALQIKDNILKTGSFSVGGVSNVMSLTFVCEVIEVDPVSGQYNTSYATFPVSALVQGGSVSVAVCSTPQGNVFKNGGVATLPASCTLYMSAIVDDTASYQWYVQETGATDDKDAIAKDVPGVGWKKLTGAYSVGTTGYTTPTLTVPATAVPSLESFMCIVTDTESKAKYFDTVTFVDQSDPFQLVVYSSNGDTFKRGGNATTEISATLYQNGTQIDAAGTKYDYLWSKRKANGDADSTFVPNFKVAGSKNLIIVTTADIASKAVFTVEVKPKP